MLFIDTCACTSQIPDVKTGNDRVDAVVVDEASVGSVNSAGSGGKVLRGEGALEKYLAETRLEDLTVSFIISSFGFVSINASSN